MRIEIDQTHAGARADAFVAAHFAVSRSRAKELLAASTLNEAPVKASQTLKIGDRLEIEASALEAPPQSTLEPLATDLPLPPIIYEDDDLMVVNKPRGLTVHAGAGEPVTTLVDLLRAHGRTLSSVGPVERGGIVHRLDKETTGLMIVCKTDAAHWKLAADFEARRIDKKYRALLCGVPKVPLGGRGRIEAPLARHPIQRQKQAVVADGRPAVTEYEVLQSWPKFALVEVDLLTGRTHQIRVHFAYLGNAVAGDPLYGGVKRALESAPDEATRAAFQTMHGQALHAAKLSFTHPTSGITKYFEAPLPPDFQAVIDALNAAQESEAERTRFVRPMPVAPPQRDATL